MLLCAEVDGSRALGHWIESERRASRSHSQDVDADSILAMSSTHNSPYAVQHHHSASSHSSSATSAAKLSTAVGGVVVNQQVQEVTHTTTVHQTETVRMFAAHVHVVPPQTKRRKPGSPKLRTQGSSVLDLLNPIQIRRARFIAAGIEDDVDPRLAALDCSGLGDRIDLYSGDVYIETEFKFHEPIFKKLRINLRRDQLIRVLQAQIVFTRWDILYGRALRIAANVKDAVVDDGVAAAAYDAMFDEKTLVIFEDHAAPPSTSTPCTVGPDRKPRFQFLSEQKMDVLARRQIPETTVYKFTLAQKLLFLLALLFPRGNAADFKVFITQAHANARRSTSDGDSDDDPRVDGGGGDASVPRASPFLHAFMSAIVYEGPQDLERLAFPLWPWPGEVYENDLPAFLMMFDPFADVASVLHSMDQSGATSARTPMTPSHIARSQSDALTPIMASILVKRRAGSNGAVSTHEQGVLTDNHIFFFVAWFAWCLAVELDIKHGGDRLALVRRAVFLVLRGAAPTLPATVGTALVEQKREQQKQSSSGVRLSIFDESKERLSAFQRDLLDVDLSNHKHVVWLATIRVLDEKIAESNARLGRFTTATFNDLTDAFKNLQPKEQVSKAFYNMVWAALRMLPHLPFAVSEAESLASGLAVFDDGVARTLGVSVDRLNHDCLRDIRAHNDHEALVSTFLLPLESAVIQVQQRRVSDPLLLHRLKAASQAYRSSNAVIYFTGITAWELRRCLASSWADFSKRLGWAGLYHWNENGWALSEWTPDYGPWDAFDAEREVFGAMMLLRPDRYYRFVNYRYIKDVVRRHLLTSEPVGCSFSGLHRMQNAAFLLSLLRPASAGLLDDVILYLDAALGFSKPAVFTGGDYTATKKFVVEEVLGALACERLLMSKVSAALFDLVKHMRGCSILAFRTAWVVLGLLIPGARFFYTNAAADYVKKHSFGPQLEDHAERPTDAVDWKKWVKTLSVYFNDEPNIPDACTELAHKELIAIVAKAVKLGKDTRATPGTTAPLWTFLAPITVKLPCSRLRFATFFGLPVKSIAMDVWRDNVHDLDTGADAETQNRFSLGSHVPRDPSNCLSKELLRPLWVFFFALCNVPIASYEQLDVENKPFVMWLLRAARDSTLMAVPGFVSQYMPKVRVFTHAPVTKLNDAPMRPLFYSLRNEFFASCGGQSLGVEQPVLDVTGVGRYLQDLVVDRHKDPRLMSMQITSLAKTPQQQPVTKRKTENSPSKILGMTSARPSARLRGQPRSLSAEYSPASQHDDGDDCPYSPTSPGYDDDEQENLRMNSW